MIMRWTPPGTFCRKCGGPNPAEIKCGSCDYKPGDPLFEKDELFTKEQIIIRVAILNSLGCPVKKRLKKFL